MKPIPLVYFVTAIDKDKFPVKIGRSNSESIHGRLSTLQTAHPYRLGFLYVMCGGSEQERNAHKAFSDIRLQGEWFRRTADLLRVIDFQIKENPDWRFLLSFPHIEYDEDGKRIMDDEEIIAPFEDVHG